MNETQRKIAIFSSIGIAAIIAVLTVSWGGNMVSTPKLDINPDSSGNETTLIDSSEIAGSTDNIFPFNVSENTKFFVIGYPIAIQPETAQKVSVNDRPWLKDIVEDGESMVSIDEAKQVYETSAKSSSYYAISLQDGTTKYYDMDIYDINLIPNTAYLKAYWINTLPKGESFQQTADSPFQQIQLNDYPWLKNAIYEKSRWVPLENPAYSISAQQFIENAEVNNIVIVHEDGTIGFYNLRYIGPDHVAVN